MAFFVPQNNTYQAILAFDANQGASFAIFLYQDGGMLWSPTNNRNNWMGISAPGDSLIEVINTPYAGKVGMFRIDQRVGNTGTYRDIIHNSRLYLPCRNNIKKVAI